MANLVLDNGSLGTVDISTKLLSGSHHVQGVELVTATEAGGRVDLAKAEDTLHVSGDYGIPMLGVRKDIAASLPGADGEYTLPIFDAQNRLHVNIGAALAANRTTDSVGIAHQTDAIMAGLTQLTPRFASWTVAAGSTDFVLIAAVASKRLRILALAAHCGATATDATFESDEATDVRVHKIPAGANGGQILPFNPVGWFQTAAGSALLVTTCAGSPYEITLSYVEV